MNIKELRNKINYSQQRLSDEIDIPKGRIAQWEAGNGNPKAEDFNKLVNFFIKKGLLSASDYSVLSRDENRELKIIIDKKEKEIEELKQKSKEQSQLIELLNEKLSKVIKRDVSAKAH